MRTLLPFLKPYRKECVLAPLFKLLEAVLELFVPLIMAAIIANGIQARDTGYVLRMGPVSYTHLDVYKRQVSVHRHRRVFPLSRSGRLRGTERLFLRGLSKQCPCGRSHALVLLGLP